MIGSGDDRIGGSRREFLRTAAIAGGSAALVPAGSAWAAPAELPMVTLGKTGQKVPALGMGTSWAVAPSFVQAALASGIRYIDTSETYERGAAERTLGAVIARSGLRKEIYLVTKNSSRKIGGSGAFAAYERQLNASLQRLKTDYVDCYYLHGVSGKELPLFKDPDVKAAFEKLKKSGKIRFCGLSCHDRQLPEIVTAAAECGFIDQIMIQYNYRTMHGDEIRRALDAAAKANLGLVAMKTQAGAEEFKPDDAPAALRPMMEKGFNQPQAAIKTIFAEHRMQAVVSEMTNRDQLRENMAAAANPVLSSREQRVLDEYRQATAHLYCHGCGHHCEPAAGGVAVAEILRYLRYDEAYGKRSRARELYQALSPEARNIARADLAATQTACPHGLPVADLLRRADEKLS
jgi:predicted aldo/keto reductase-like oxidoreductase